MNDFFYYQFICFLCLTDFYVIILMGLIDSVLPGTPTISRFIIDDYELISFLYVPFVILLHEIRSISVARHYKSYSYPRIVAVDCLGYLQTVSFLMVLVADMDFMPTEHFFFATLIVVVTLLREVVFSWIEYEKYGLFKSSLLIRILFIFLNFSLALAFFVINLTVSFSEFTTDAAMIEFVLYMSIVFTNCFYLD